MLVLSSNGPDVPEQYYHEVSRCLQYIQLPNRSNRREYNMFFGAPGRSQKENENSSSKFNSICLNEERNTFNLKGTTNKAK